MKTLAISLALLIMGCNLTESEKVNDDDLVIVPGESIAGIHLGDSEAVVRERLGVPDSRQVSYSGSVAYHYTDGQYAGLILRIDPTPDGVRYITAQPEYKGKLTNGVGIGSSLEELVSNLGEPTHEIRGRECPVLCGVEYHFSGGRLTFSLDDKNEVQKIMFLP